MTLPEAVWLLVATIVVLAVFSVWLSEYRNAAMPTVLLSDEPLPQTFVAADIVGAEPLPTTESATTDQIAAALTKAPAPKRKPKPKAKPKGKRP